MENKFMPQPVTDADIAFPANVAHLMPKYEDIPQEFCQLGNKWNKFQRDWFYRGLKSLQFTPKAGIDPAMAFRHLRCIQGSYQPKHEHKEAAVAYLASLWFDDVQYESGPV